VGSDCRNCKRVLEEIEKYALTKTTGRNAIFSHVVDGNAVQALLNDNSIHARIVRSGAPKLATFVSKTGCIVSGLDMNVTADADFFDEIMFQYFMRMGKINEITLALGEGSQFECIYLGGSTRGAAQRAAQSNISSNDKRAYTSLYLTMFCMLTQEYYKATKESCLEGRLRKARDKAFLECAHVPEFRAGGAGLCNTADFRDAPVFVGALGDGNWTVNQKD
jgi:hypothetical protein